jgi:hypothetical protein
MGDERITLIDEKIAISHEFTLKEVDQRSLAMRLLDGAARLASPYL